MWAIVGLSENGLGGTKLKAKTKATKAKRAKCDCCTRVRMARKPADPKQSHAKVCGDCVKHYS